MSYFQPYLDTDGLHLPTYQERMEELLAGYQRIFGEDAYLGEDSQDYQLLSLFAKHMDDMTSLLVDVYNARNPNLARASALDHLLPLSGIRRLSATPSTVSLRLEGTSGATLPPAMQARDSNGRIWRVPGAVSFDENGKATADAVCTAPGAVMADANTITMIDTPTGTWRTVTNPAPAVPGRDMESDAAARERRALSVSLPSRSILEGMIAAVCNLPGVDYTAAYENADSKADANGLPAHSLCAVVSGGKDEDIARVLYLKKSPGVATYGNTSAVYVDEYRNQNTMRFSRPVSVMVSVQIKLRPLFGWDAATMNQAIPQAVAQAVNSIGIGKGLLVPTLYGAAFGANEGDTLSFAVTSVTASTAAQTATADTITASYDQRLVCDAAHVTLTVEGDSEDEQ